ncbi:MAG: hypothetical protein OXE96_04360 [Gemmatimonadetes bacterium]|nr:hypothetical protein [Gemmatimonadota bacterium]
MSRLGAVLFFLTACSAPLTEPPRDLEPVDRCPAPGEGIDIGGLPGTGADTKRLPLRRLVLMGGGREEVEATRLFVGAAVSGDVVVLRTSGSLTSYIEYFTAGLTASSTPATLVTIRTNDPFSGDDPAVLCRLGRAEAVWIAGGNQWNYLGRWPPALHTALAEVAERGAAMGGISAGAVSLGEAAFDAQHGTVTSVEALADPMHRKVSVSRSAFAQPELSGVLVDSHFQDRQREGRLLVFLARFLADRAEGPVVGLGLDEGVAVTIEADAYQVTSAQSGSAWLYEVTGPALLRPGEPLTLNGIRRVKLDAGSTGSWPFDWAAAAGRVRPMHVLRGAVRVGTSP